MPGSFTASVLSISRPALQLVEERAPDGSTRVDEVISEAEFDAIASRFALDAETVNSRPRYLPAGEH